MVGRIKAKEAGTSAPGRRWRGHPVLGLDLAQLVSSSSPPLNYFDSPDKKEGGFSLLIFTPSGLTG
jgi:hypothetical protein